MIDLSRTTRGIAAAVALVAMTGTLAGCANDSIEFQGKIFETIGLAGDGLGKRTDAKTQARAPLVVPPDTTKLPEPGSAPVPVVANQDWPQDRESRRTADAEARRKAQEQFCRDGNWREKALKKDDIEAAQGPEGSCNNNILTWMSKGLFGSGE